MTEPHVLHILGSLAAGVDAERLATAMLGPGVYQEAPDFVTVEHWMTASCVLVEDDTTDELLRGGFGHHRRRSVVVLGHDLDDASIWERAIALGAEVVAFLPHDAHLVVAALHESTQATA